LSAASQQIAFSSREIRYTAVCAMSWLTVVLAVMAYFAYVSAEHCSLPEGAVLGSVVKDESGQLAFSTRIEPGVCHACEPETCMVLHEEVTFSRQFVPDCCSFRFYCGCFTTMPDAGALLTYVQGLWLKECMLILLTLSATSASSELPRQLHIQDIDQMSAAGFLEGYCDRSGRAQTELNFTANTTTIVLLATCSAHLLVRSLFPGSSAVITASASQQNALCAGIRCCLPEAVHDVCLQPRIRQPTITT